jgi:drug/metabolite transporter (DMT)-like permease
MRTENLAKIAVAFSGIAWGLFWIPLRGLDNAGMGSFWALVIFNALPALILLPLFLLRLRQQISGGRWLFAIGIAMGFTQFFYSLSVLHTEIVRAMILFYFNPVWATLMARVFLGEAITPIRWLSIAVAFTGMFIILYVDQGFPWPKNGGDWAAVVAGIQNYLVTGLLLLPLLAVTGADNAPPASLVLGQLWWVLPFIFLIAMPGVYMSMWAVPLLAPAIVTVLYMTEISAAAISSALWSGEPFGLREISGITLITVAAVLESARDLWRERKSNSVIPAKAEIHSSALKHPNE